MFDNERFDRALHLLNWTNVKSLELVEKRFVWASILFLHHGNVRADKIFLSKKPALCSCMQNWVYRTGFAAQAKNYESWNLSSQNILLLATSAMWIHKFEQLALVMSQQSYVHKNYYRHFIKIYETKYKINKTHFRAWFLQRTGSTIERGWKSAAKTRASLKLHGLWFLLKS